MIFFGTQNYGKVDHIPGLFYVRTSFFHLQFFPLIPTSSHLILDRPGDPVGVSIPISGKSVLWAYLRAAVLIGVAFLAIATLIQYLESSRSGEPLGPSFLITLGATIAATVLAFLLFRSPRPSLQRAIKLGEHIGLPHELVEHFWNQQQHAQQSSEAETVDSDASPCTDCLGMRKQTVQTTDRDGLPMTREVDCPACQGKGVIASRA